MNSYQKVMIGIRAIEYKKAEPEKSWFEVVQESSLFNEIRLNTPELEKIVKTLENRIRRNPEIMENEVSNG